MADWNKYLGAILFLSGGIFLAMVLEFLLLRRLRKSAQRTVWKADDVIVKSFKGILFVWSVGAGVYFGVNNAPFAPHVVAIVEKVIFSAVVISVTLLVARICVGLIQLKSTHDGHTQSTSIVSNIVRIAVYVIGGLIVLQAFGISVTPLLTALGVGALAVALALQDTLTNLFSGIQVIASRQVKIGDYVKLESGGEGYITDITWRNTVICMLSNNNIIVPNSKIASSILTNYSMPQKDLSVRIEVGVSYDSDLDKVEAITLEAAREVMKSVEGSVPEFEPSLRFNSFGESAINLAVTLRTREFNDQFLLRHEFVKLLTLKYRENDIRIPFPIRTVVMKKE